MTEAECRASCSRETSDVGRRRLRVLLVILSLLTACASRPPPLPPDYAWSLPWGAVSPETGSTVGMADGFGHVGHGVLPADLDDDGRPNYSLLLISGGGAKGAFGAGVLKGWSEEGSRPEFSVVTGVSTGALMASWAFLGSHYDDELEYFYTELTDAKIFRRRNRLLALFGDSLLDTKPLRQTIAGAVDAGLLDEVAGEYRKGRRLYIASTDLDHTRLVVWDLGAIAASDRPGKLERYREAGRAAASIPVAFPPVYFPVEVDGQEFSQMHVDGGAVANFFMTSFILDRQRALLPTGMDRRDVDIDIYLLVNGHLQPSHQPEPISPHVLPIALAASWATSWSAQTNQLVRAYRAATGIGAGFHLAGVPEDYDGALPMTSFDPEVTVPLFRYGESLARKGELWLSEPPGIDWRERTP
jgi:predicted acylesterase/phospholipase RssA